MKKAITGVWLRRWKYLNVYVMTIIFGILGNVFIDQISYSLLTHWKLILSGANTLSGNDGAPAVIKGHSHQGFTLPTQKLL